MRKQVTFVLVLIFLSPIFLSAVSYGATAWSVQTVDGSAGDVGSYCSLVLDSNGIPHVCYYDLANGDLKYAKRAGSGWSVMAVDQVGDVGTHGSLGLDSNGNPRISYYDATNGDLKYAMWTGSSWVVEVVDSAGDVGLHSSLAVDSGGNAHVSYYDASNGDLKYARWTGSGWSVTVVDQAGNVGRYTSLALDAGGSPHIGYHDGTNGDLKYARLTGSGWSVAAVDQAGNVGRYCSLFLDSGDSPHMSYYDAALGDLKYAKKTISGWSIALVDQAGNVGLSSSLFLDSGGNPHVTYYDATNGGLKYAWYYAGFGWVIGTVASTGEALAYSSLALDSNGNPHVCYYEYTNSDLKYAFGQTTPPPPKVALPTFSPAGGTYSSSQSVSLSCATSGATIRFTLDGSEPSASSAAYVEPIAVSSTTTVKAKAFKSGMSDSDTATATYVISVPPKVAAPVFTPSSGSYSVSQNVELSCGTDGATVRYTVDGSEPSLASPEYAGPIPVNSGTLTVKARAFKSGMTESDVASAVYTIDPLKVSVPNFSPAGGSYSVGQSVSVSCATSDAVVRYTVDGSEPTSSSAVYSAPILVSSGAVTVKAKAFKSEMTDSDTASATYTIVAEAVKVAAPTFSPLGGSYSSTQDVVLSCGTEGAVIRFTVDGSEPSSSSTVYSGSISVGSTTTIKARAFKHGMTESDVVSATYVISIPAGKVVAPAFSIPGGTYPAAQSVELSCFTEGATIRYTVDGSEPSAESSVYSGAIQVSSGTLTIRAKAFKSGMVESDVATATYTIGSVSDEEAFPWEAIYIAAFIVVAVVVIVAVVLRRKRGK
jgi:hypothetical protein